MLAAAERISVNPLSCDNDRKICTVLTLVTLTSRQLSPMEVVESEEVETSIRGGAAAAINRPNSAGALMMAMAAKHTARMRTVTERIAGR